MSKAKGGSRGRNPARVRSSARKGVQTRGIVLCQQGELGEAAFVHKAMSLGFAVAKPCGHFQRYDFIVEAGKKLWRVQVKTCSNLRRGLYRVGVFRSLDCAPAAYTESELDFVVVCIMPQMTWYVVPVREVVGRTALLIRAGAKGFNRRDPYGHYREAWHLLREGDGITFG
jgi:hypothetical protein